MKKLIYSLIFSIFVFSFILSCGTTSPLQPENNDEEPELTWSTVTSMDQMIGKWTSEEGDLEYPKKLDGKEFCLISDPETDDSNAWATYAQRYGTPVKEIWEKRYAAVAVIYGQNYPMADENGNQRGIKFHEPIFMTKYGIRIHSHIETLVTEDVLFKNLSLFSISSDGKMLKVNGTFRFFSSKFKNVTIQDRIYTLVEE